MAPPLVTIERHILEMQRQHEDARGMFTDLLYDIALAAKIIGREVSKAGLLDILGIAGHQNVSGDEVQKLDVYADEVIRRVMDHTGRLCVMASEEQDGIIPIPEDWDHGDYVLLYDPLDGSSNIDANVSIGTIFSIHRKISDGPHGTLEDCLQPGYKQAAAGYVIYGASTMLVFTTGHGVHGFTYDPSVGEFLLSHKEIRIPERGKIYSVNEQNYNYWDEGVRRYIDHVKAIDPNTNRPYSLRYIGSMVADIHRNLLYGGVFMYPADNKDPRKSRGKLRLLYEACPLALVVEQAGGYASDGQQRILDIEPTELHQRVPLYIGSKEDVLEAERFVQGKQSG